MPCLRSRRAGVAASALCVLFAGLFTACAEPSGGDESAQTALPATLPAESLSVSLAYALNDEYRVDSLAAQGVGRISGSVQYDGALPPDTLVRPTHDLSICKAVADAPLTGSRDGIGDALVWLVGVTHGAADRSPRRVQLTLQDCTIRPRIQRAPVGATLLVRSADAMDARLRFLDATVESRSPATTGASISPVDAAPRALVPLGSAGAVVPVTAVLARPGLVEVRDDRHPWVRGWIAVAPHPYVTMTDARGEFTLDGVPPGSYVLVTWHERLGTRATPVVVDAGVDTRLRVMLPER